MTPGNSDTERITCPSCGHEFLPWGEPKFCESCGAPLAAARERAEETPGGDAPAAERPAFADDAAVPKQQAPATPEPPESQVPVGNRLDIGSYTPPVDREGAIDELVDDALDEIEEILGEAGDPEVPPSRLGTRPSAPPRTDVSGNVVGGSQSISVEQEGSPGSSVKAGDNVATGDQRIEVRSTGSVESDGSVAGGNQHLGLASAAGGAGPVKVSADGNVVQGDQTVHITQVFGSGTRFGLGDPRMVIPGELRVGETSRMTFTVKNTGSVPIDQLRCSLTSSSPDGWAEIQVTRQAPGRLGPSAEALFEAEVTPLMAEAGYVTFHWLADYLKEGILYEYPFETHRFAEGVSISGGAASALTADDFVRLDVACRAAGGLATEVLVFAQTLTVGGAGKSFQKRENLLSLEHPVDPKYISSQAADIRFESGSFRLKNFHRAALDGEEIKKYKTKPLTGRHSLELGGGAGQSAVRSELDCRPDGLFPHLRVECPAWPEGRPLACWLIPGDIGLTIGADGLRTADSSLGAEIRFLRLNELFMEIGETATVDGESRDVKFAPRAGMVVQCPEGALEILSVSRGRIESSGLSPQGWGL